ncbi:DUF5391 family protein [Microbacteriaceae bacterium 4G12]
MEKKKKVMITTVLSAILFCSLVVVSSLSPLADSGPTTNKFGSLGMWASIGIVLALYIIPLVCYMAGMDWMRFVMATFCSVGLLMNLFTFLFILGISVFDSGASDLLGVIVLCIAATLINIIWFVVAFRSPSIPQKAHV